MSLSLVVSSSVHVNDSTCYFVTHSLRRSFVTDADLLCMGLNGIIILSAPYFFSGQVYENKWFQVQTKTFHALITF